MVDHNHDTSQETVAKEPAVAASILEMQAVVQHDHPVLLDIAYVVTDPQTVLPYTASLCCFPILLSLPHKPNAFCYIAICVNIIHEGCLTLVN
jgi:hypothetical protein